MGSSCTSICFPKHFAHGNSKNEIRQETDEECKKRGVSIERSKAGMKERSPDHLIKIQ